MPHDGHGGNDLYKAKVSWNTNGHAYSANWVIKRWYPGGLTSVAMGITSPAEALAWSHGLLRPEMLPENMIAPFIGVRLDENDRSAWIFMDDVSNELNEFRSPESPEEHLRRARCFLDRLACFHAYWEQEDHFTRLQGYSWLLQQDAWLRFLKDLYAEFIQQKSQKVKWPISEKHYSKWRKATCAFLDWLPEADRALWEKHLCNPEPLIASFSGLPQTLLHGDLDLRNLGLRLYKGRTEPVFIDWEWVGIGAHALDVVRLIASMEKVARIPDDIRPCPIIISPVMLCMAESD